MEPHVPARLASAASRVNGLAPAAAHFAASVCLGLAFDPNIGAEGANFNAYEGIRCGKVVSDTHRNGAPRPVAYC
jgi:hypothetical protein